MMYWLLVFLFDGTSGEYLLRHEIAVKDRIVCEQALKDYSAPKGFTARKICLSDGQLNKIKETGTFPKD